MRAGKQFSWLLVKTQSQFMTSHHENTTAEIAQIDARCRRASCRWSRVCEHGHMH